MNRGVARRTLFESNHDIRTFLCFLARAVRAGRIEVHAYCVLSTHFHMLLRSPNGDLSGALQEVQNRYARWFNRGRQRDGPLMRGRFLSKRVGTLSYRCHLVRYIDFNAVDARLVSTPALYPHGSARWYARRSGPPWLTRSWIESVVRRQSPHAEFGPASYSSTFGEPLSPGLRRLVERRTTFPENAVDPLDELIHAAPPGVLDWMRRKAALADGTKVGYPVSDPEELDGFVALAASARGDWHIKQSRKSLSAWPIVRVGLLRDLCASTLEDAASRTGMSCNAAWRAHRRHRDLLTNDPEYSRLVAELATSVLRRCHGSMAHVVAHSAS